MEINPGDTAWVLVASAMVLLMTPGLALFYGGMTRAKSTLNMMMMSFSAIGVVTVLWVAFGARHHGRLLRRQPDAEGHRTR